MFKSFLLLFDTILKNNSQFPTEENYPVATSKSASQDFFRLSHATECWKNLGENGDYRDAGAISPTITTPPEIEKGVCKDINP